MLVNATIIFFAKVIEMSLSSLKTQFLCKGERLRAVILAFLEACVWVFACSKLITSLTDYLELSVAYILGYTLGVYVGSFMEKLLAVGDANIRITVLPEYAQAVSDVLVDMQQGFTVVDAAGATGPVKMFMITIPRKKVKSIIDKVNDATGIEVFYTKADTSTAGGYCIL